MPNMSYCRYHNTLIDLRDCWSNWYEQDDSELSKEEKQAKARMKKLILEMASELEQEED